MKHSVRLQRLSVRAATTATEMERYIARSEKNWLVPQSERVTRIRPRRKSIPAAKSASDSGDLHRATWRQQRRTKTNQDSLCLVVT